MTCTKSCTLTLFYMSYSLVAKVCMYPSPRRRLDEQHDVTTCESQAVGAVHNVGIQMNSTTSYTVPLFCDFCAVKESIVSHRKSKSGHCSFPAAALAVN